MLHQKKLPGFLSELSTFNSEISWAKFAALFVFLLVRGATLHIAIPHPGNQSNIQTQAPSYAALRSAEIEDATASSPEVTHGSTIPTTRNRDLKGSPPFSVKLVPMSVKSSSIPSWKMAMSWGLDELDRKILFKNWGGGQSRYTLRELSPPAIVLSESLHPSEFFNMRLLSLKMNETLQ